MGNETTIAGLVLCGGASQRMGTDKGLIMKDGLPWFRHMGMLIENLLAPVYYSVRSTQVDSYSVFVDRNNLVIDDEISEGPLRGVLSCLNSVPVSSLLVLPCDMLELDTGVLEALLQHYRDLKYDFFAYVDGDFFQTFPAIYSRDGIRQATDTGSLQKLLKNGKTFGLPIRNKAHFSNYNQRP